MHLKDLVVSFHYLRCPDLLVNYEVYKKLTQRVSWGRNESCPWLNVDLFHAKMARTTISKSKLEWSRKLGQIWLNLVSQLRGKKVFLPLAYCAQVFRIAQISLQCWCAIPYCTNGRGWKGNFAQFISIWEDFILLQRVATWRIAIAGGNLSQGLLRIPDYFLLGEMHLWFSLMEHQFLDLFTIPSFGIVRKAYDHGIAQPFQFWKKVVIHSNNFWFGERSLFSYRVPKR